MAATDFPANPTTGQTYTANGRTWTWNGTAWVRSSPLIPSNPMSAIGDIIIGGSGGTPERLPVGANGTVATSNGTTVVWQAVTGTGTVTSVSVVTANGVSGSVANSTTAPAITLTLGDITPSKVETPEIKFPDPTSVNYIELAVTPAGLTDIRGVVFPDKDGTIALEGQHSHVASDIASMPANSVLVNPTTSTGTGQTVALSPSELLGRGSTGDVASITIGSNLVFSGTQLDLNSASVSITGGSIGGTTSINTTGSLTAAGTVSFTSATAGAVSTSADITVNGLRLGRGNSGAITSTAFGDRSLSSATGADNTAFGAEALRFATSSTLNVAFGGNSLRNLTSSSNNNSAIGVSAFRELTSGSSNNVAIGINAGRYQTAGDVNLTTCNNSVFIGAASRASANNQTNQVVIGGLAAIGDGSNTTVIGNTSTTQTRIPAGKFVVSDSSADAINTPGGVSSGTITASGAVSFTSATAGAVSTSADITVNGIRVGVGANGGSSTVAIGAGAAGSRTGGTNGVYIGQNAGASGSGSDLTLIGASVLTASGTSLASTIVGRSAFQQSTTINRCVGVGFSVGRYFGVGGTNVVTTLTDSILIGSNARPSADSQTNIIVIANGGTNGAISDGSNTTVIGTSSTTQSRLFGGNALTTGANGQSTQLGQATTASPTPTTSGATVTVAALIPANSIVIGVTARVTTAITGATSFDIGDGTTANLFGDDVAVALDTTSANTIAPTRYATATNVVLTANGGNFTAGAVRLTVHFLTLVAPTS